MKEKAFTLVELLAVIIILGVLSVLIVPKAIKTLNDSEQKTNIASAEGLLKAAKYKYQDDEMNGKISENITIDYTTNTNIDLLDFNGKQPEKGQVIIRSNGNVGMFVKIGDNCYFKNYNSLDITVTPYSEETCGQSIKIVTSGDGLYESATEPGRLIYRGLNPNNYIYLKEDGINDTLYRIVSYETDGTIKVIRDDRISKDGDNFIEFDIQNSRPNPPNTFCGNICNVWGNQNTMLHNGTPMGDNFRYIYYESDSATTFTDSLSGTVTSDSTLNTYLNSTWLPTFLDKYIDNHTWNVGALYDTYETSPLGFTKSKQTEQQLQWIGKVGLLTITEYAEASTNTGCIGMMSGIDPLPCGGNSNWTAKEYNQWSITAEIPYFANGLYHVWIMSPWGTIHYHSARHLDVSARPAFYLKANVNLTGEGTELNPYRIIGM